MVRKVGRDNGKEIVLGKDLQGIRRIENSQDAISALVGVGPFNEETGEYLTFERSTVGSYTSLMQMPYNVGQKMVHTNMTSIVHKQKIKICQPKD